MRAKLNTRLCEEKHSVVIMIDSNQQILNEAEKIRKFYQSVKGTHPKILRQAEVDKADLLFL